MRPLDGGGEEEARFSEPALVQQDQTFAVQRLDKHIGQLQSLRKRKRALERLDGLL